MLFDSPHSELCTDLPTLKHRLISGFHHALKTGEIKDAAAVERLASEMQLVDSREALESYCDTHGILHPLRSAETNTVMIDFDCWIALERCKYFWTQSHQDNQRRLP